MKTSLREFVSPKTRLLDSLAKPTYLPSAEIEDCVESEVPWVPVELTLSPDVFPVWQSWMKTSSLPLVSPTTRLLAELEKVTYRPLADMSGLEE